MDPEGRLVKFWGWSEVTCRFLTARDVGTANPQKGSRVNCVHLVGDLSKLRMFIQFCDLSPILELKGPFIFSSQLLVNVLNFQDILESFVSH